MWRIMGVDTCLDHYWQHYTCNYEANTDKISKIVGAEHKSWYIRSCIWTNKIQKVDLTSLIYQMWRTMGVLTCLNHHRQHYSHDYMCVIRKNVGVAVKNRVRQAPKSCILPFSDAEGQAHIYPWKVHLTFETWQHIGETLGYRFYSMQNGVFSPNLRVWQVGGEHKCPHNDKQNQHQA